MTAPAPEPIAEARRFLAEVTRLANLSVTEQIEYAAGGVHVGKTQQTLALASLAYSAVAIAETLGHLLDVVVEAAAEGTP